MQSITNTDYYYHILGRVVHVASTGRLPSPPHGRVVASYAWLTCRTSPGLANMTRRRHFQKYKFFGSCWERTTSTACTPAWSRGTWCVYCVYSGMVAWYMMCLPDSRASPRRVYCVYSAMVAWYMMHVLRVLRHGRVVHDACTVCTPVWSRGTWCMYCVYSGMVAWYMMHVLRVLRHGYVVHDASTWLACTNSPGCWQTWPVGGVFKSTNYSEAVGSAPLLLLVLRHGRVVHAMVAWYMVHVLRVLRHGRVVHDASTWLTRINSPGCWQTWPIGGVFKSTKSSEAVGSAPGRTVSFSATFRSFGNGYTTLVHRKKGARSFSGPVYFGVCVSLACVCVLLISAWSRHMHHLAGVGKHDPSEAFSKAQNLQKLLGAHQVERFVFSHFLLLRERVYNAGAQKTGGGSHFRGLFILACLSLVCVCALRCVCVLLIWAGSMMRVLRVLRHGHVVHAMVAWYMMRVLRVLRHGREVHAMVAWYMMCLPDSRASTRRGYCVYSAMVVWYIPWSRGTWCVYCLYSGMVTWYMMCLPDSRASPRRGVLPVLRHGRVALFFQPLFARPGAGIQSWCTENRGRESFSGPVYFGVFVSGLCVCTAHLGGVRRRHSVTYQRVLLISAWLRGTFGIYRSSAFSSSRSRGSVVYMTHVPHLARVGKQDPSEAFSEVHILWKLLGAHHFYCMYSAMVAWYMPWSRGIWCVYCVYSGMVALYMMCALRVLRHGRVVHDACTACTPAWSRGTWCVYLTHVHQLAGVGKHDPSEAFSKVQNLQKLLGAHQVERFVFQPLFARPGAGIQRWCTEKRGGVIFWACLFWRVCLWPVCMYCAVCVYCSSRRGQAAP